MKKEFIIVFLSVLLLFILVGVFFAFNSVSTENELDSSPAKEVISNVKINEKIIKPASEAIVKKEIIAPKVEAPLNSVIPQKVVDQTLPIAIAKEEKTIIEESIKAEKPLPVKKIIHENKEKIEIEITLYDGEQNKLLIDYDIELKFQYRNEPVNSENFTTNKEGKLIFIATQAGPVVFNIFSKEYSVNSSQMVIRYGKNEYQAKLYKGGSIEVHAINDENLVVENLETKIGYSKEAHRDSIFIKSKGVYVVSNLPLGSQYFTFKAKGYRVSTHYLIRVESQDTAQMEIKLSKTRKLYYDLDINPKPEVINISKYKYYDATNKVPGLEQTEVLKNENNQYELELPDRGNEFVTIYVDGYIPQKVKILNEIDTYKVSLEKGYSAKVQIKNEKGNPILGASVVYADSIGGFKWNPKGFNKGTFRKIAVTDKNGLALLTGLTEKIELELKVSRKDFAEYFGNLSFDQNLLNSKDIVLKSGINIIGKVLFEGRPVEGVKLLLFESGNPTPLDTISSDNNGKYSFDHFEGKADKDYCIKAFHRELGVKITPHFKFENKNFVNDLILAKEISVTIKLKDSNGTLLPNKNITISHNSDPQSRLSGLTNEQGEFEGCNLIHGDYTIRLNDKNLFVKEAHVKIPASLVELKAEQKLLKKVNVTTSNGSKYRGKLEVKNGRNLSAYTVNMGDDGFYLEFENENVNVFGQLIFEADGYAVIAMGPYEKVKEIPNELNIKLLEGENLRIKVVDDRDYKPIPSAMVYISSGGTEEKPIKANLPSPKNASLNQLSSNEYGEVLFKRLSGKVKVFLQVENYAPFESEVDTSQTNEFVAKLMKGGGLKGHLTLGANFTRASVSLVGMRYGFSVDKDGNFEMKNIMPGEYLIAVTRFTKNGNMETKNLPNKIKIINDQTLEIKLDESLKN